MGVCPFVLVRVRKLTRRVPSPARRGIRTREPAGQVLGRCAADAAGILALYMRLGTDTEPEHLSITSLGAWDGETTDLARSLSQVSFGVRRANGVTMPWTTGVEPAQALADNSRVQGTATWNGDLIGFTPTLDGARGDAEISVNLGTMNGRAGRGLARPHRTASRHRWAPTLRAPPRCPCTPLEVTIPCSSPIPQYPNDKCCAV